MPRTTRPPTRNATPGLYGLHRAIDRNRYVVDLQGLSQSGLQSIKAVPDFGGQSLKVLPVQIHSAVFQVGPGAAREMVPVLYGQNHSGAASSLVAEALDSDGPYRFGGGNTRSRSGGLGQSL